jgi:hypothetical protein
VRRFLALVVVSIVVSGIMFSSGAASSTYRDRNASFRYPASWHAYHWQIPAEEVTFVLWLSNAPLRDPCTIRTRTEYKCGEPIGRLPRGGVLVTWSVNHLGGQVTKLSIVRPGYSCGEIGGDESMLQTFSSGYVAQACLRGPGLRASERQVRAMIASARFSRSSD